MKAASQRLIPKTHAQTAAAVALVFMSAVGRFAVVAQEAAFTRDLPRALSDVTANCVACHAGYPIK